MNNDNCELRYIKDGREYFSRKGLWAELVERVNLPLTINGTYVIVSDDRRMVLVRSGNEGPGGKPGTVTVTEDGPYDRSAEQPSLKSKDGTDAWK